MMMKWQSEYLVESRLRRVLAKVLLPEFFGPFTKLTDGIDMESTSACRGTEEDIALSHV